MGTTEFKRDLFFDIQGEIVPLGLSHIPPPRPRAEFGATVVFSPHREVVTSQGIVSYVPCKEW